MPLVSVQVTKDIEEGTETESFLKALSEIVARQTGKPEAYCMTILSKASIMMAGVPRPAAFVEVRAIGGLSASVTRQLSGELCFLISSHLDIPKDRIYLNFFEIAPSNWGWNGATF